jgi:hypothetical protein
LQIQNSLFAKNLVKNIHFLLGKFRLRWTVGRLEGWAHKDIKAHDDAQRVERWLFLHPLHCFGKMLNWVGPLTTYGNSPAPRGGHTSTFVVKKLFVFGGSAYSAKGLNPGGRESPLTIVKSDLHVLDLATMTWSIPAVQGIQPPARYAHTGTLMGNKLIIFGGFNGRVYLDDLSVLDTSKSLDLMY